MLEKVIDILSEFTMMEKEKITKESGLINDLGLNSLDVINVVVVFEEEFNIEIPDSKIKELATVGDIVEYLGTHA
ncbi:MAG: acyl carrier protein [Bacteroides sp.]